jgi:hypothetical protein
MTVILVRPGYSCSGTNPGTNPPVTNLVKASNKLASSSLGTICCVGTSTDLTISYSAPKNLNNINYLQASVPPWCQTTRRTETAISLEVPVGN